MNHRYRVLVSPDGAPDEALWRIKVDGVHGESAASDLRDAERIARKFISMSTGTPLQQVHVVVEIAKVPRHRPGGRGLGEHRPAWRWVWDRLHGAA